MRVMKNVYNVKNNNTAIEGGRTIFFKWLCKTGPQ